MRVASVGKLAVTHGFKLDYVLNEYNEREWYLEKDSKTVYKSFNIYCVESFIKGVVYGTSI